MKCQATAEEHCCWVGKAGVCPHFDPERGGPGQEGFCSLMGELGDWALVHEDPRYAEQRVFFEGFGTSLCGDFPSPAESPCPVCGAVSDG